MYLDEILKAESYAETYVLLKQMSNEELDALMGDLTGQKVPSPKPTGKTMTEEERKRRVETTKNKKPTVPSMIDLPLTPEQRQKIIRMKEAGNNMPLSTKDRMDLTSAIQEAKKRKVDKKRNKFSNVLQNKKLTQKPRVNQPQPQPQPKPQQPNQNVPLPKSNKNVPLPTKKVSLPTKKDKTEEAMRLFEGVQQRKRERNQTVPSPKTTGRTMTNEEMRQRMAAKNKPKPRVRRVVKPIPQENIKPDTQQTAQQPQQKPKKSLSQKVRDKLRILPKIEGKGNKNKLGLKTQSILDNTQRVARRRNKPADKRIRRRTQ